VQVGVAFRQAINCEGKVYGAVKGMLRQRYDRVRIVTA
jgi:hypothetical protein